MKIRNGDYTKIGRLIDVSAVRTDVTLSEIEDLVKVAKKYDCICTFVMPYYTKYLVDLLSDTPNTFVGGVVGFPSGADTTSIKVLTAKEMIATGCKELDMVINVSALKSGKYNIVKDDIKAVVDEAKGIPVKSILEIGYLTDSEIAKGSELAVEAGVTFVKTGTGWAPKPTTIETIKLIKSVIGDAAQIKAAGGVRDLDTLLQMLEAGCSRFGIGIRSAVTIFKEAYKRSGIDPVEFEKKSNTKDDY